MLLISADCILPKIETKLKLQWRPVQVQLPGFTGLSSREGAAAINGKTHIQDSKVRQKDNNTRQTQKLWNLWNQPPQAARRLPTTTQQEQRALQSCRPIKTHHWRSLGRRQFWSCREYRRCLFIKLPDSPCFSWAPETLKESSHYHKINNWISGLDWIGCTIGYGVSTQYK